VSCTPTLHHEHRIVKIDIKQPLRYAFARLNTVNLEKPMSLQECAQWLGKCPRTLRNLAAKGKIPGAFKVGADWRFMPKPLISWPHPQALSELQEYLKEVPKDASAAFILAYGLERQLTSMVKLTPQDAVLLDAVREYKTRKEVTK
jgi:hypothetical protein